MSLLICSKKDDLMSKELLKVEIPDLTMGMMVEELYQKISTHLNCSVDSIDLVGYGRVLQPGNTLGHYGIRSSSVIIVYNKRPEPKEEENTPSVPVDQEEAHRIVVALRTALVNPDFRNVIEKLKEREAQDNLMAVTPGLSEDPTALAILLDFDMLSICTEHENILKVLEKHPSLGTAATYLAAQFHEEHTSADIFRRSPRPAYSLDDMTSDDEEPDPNDASSGAGPSSGSGLPPDQLARLVRDAISRANQGIPAPSSSSSSTASRSTSTRMPASSPASTTSGPRITPEMLSMALGSVNATPPTSTPSTLSSSTAPPVTSPPAPRDWSAELGRMRELGLLNDAENIRALEASNGNVDAAVELIYSQYI